MGVINIDGKNYDIMDESTNLLAVCLSLGFNIPYFCWHPVLGSVGACRQCAIKHYVNNDVHQGKLIMSCMTPVSNGMCVSLYDEEIKRFRRNIIELLMINHPHDCPICEEGGNCHLQDMTVMAGQNSRRYRFKKRTYHNQYLGPFISHEMNRCITCYRCVRYYKDYADGKDFGVYGTHDQIYFGRIQDGMLENEFSGNLIEICPTGVFTDKTQSHHYARKWDIQFSPSVCHQCSVGCNIIIGERYGELCRIENRYNSVVNGYFLCDRGRFGCDYVNLKNRPKKPVYKKNVDNWVILSAEKAVKIATNFLKNGHSTIIGIGSSRASIESNFALRELVGQDNFYAGVHKGELNRLKLILNILYSSGVYTPSLQEIESYDAIVILGEDLTHTAARIALAVRQAVKRKSKAIASFNKIAEWHASAVMNVGCNAKYPLFITNIDCTQLDDISSWTYYATIDEQARFGFAIAHALDNSAPKVNDFDPVLQKKLNMIVRALIKSNKPLIISGSNAGSDFVIAAAANIAKSLKKIGKNVGLTFVVADANSIGLGMMDTCGSLDDALDNMQHGLIDCVILLENNPYRYAISQSVDQAFGKIKKLIILDHQHYSFHKKADLFLPSTTFAESNGTLINQECRAQRFFKCYQPDFYDRDVIALESWRWLNLIRSSYLNNDNLKWLCFDHALDAIIKEMPQFTDIKKVAPSASFRVHGRKLARSSHRCSGRTVMGASINDYDSYVPQDVDSMFTFSMEGNVDYCSLSYNHVAFAWAPGWNSSQVWNKFKNELNSHAHFVSNGIRFLSISNIQLNWFDIVPSKYVFNKNDNWCIVPYWYLFGSEEMSQRSIFIQKCMPLPCVVLNTEDANYIGISDKMLLSFCCSGQELRLPVKFSSFLSRGCLGLPLGFPGFPMSFLGMKVNQLQGILL
ncbi:NADH-quinone oxidoreductase subunit NuoG [Blochmannia endosymbiont of Camponotus (Colobopsis) obliquus]|uniref:NADH-quinone oxidoreductase subunit NuoG n=1 Tax=Blochmannia endosymbiont of Camponotus (Colobopsis) obliquus TaxID=1505597 RepID=UPI00061A57B1|nr:NADH-quinone oxidoreductase subunit NuoG [Blochmannia endosymbiont of Camponotus (Colobopsis) obliquus]AKC60640.1 NADH-quinone oxidoreductase subunit G [Blochmannia endosymbiont of Camponotus (Colobopsis) obliquus]